jgi:hypothetical protein
LSTFWSTADRDSLLEGFIRKTYSKRPSDLVLGRSHRRFVLPLIHCIPDSLRESVPLRDNATESCADVEALLAGVEALPAGLVREAQVLRGQIEVHLLARKAQKIFSTTIQSPYSLLKITGILTAQKSGVRKVLG